MTLTEQRMAALRFGNEIRCGRAEVRRQIAGLPTREGRRRAAEVIQNPGRACEGMSVYHLLVSCRQVGPRLATRMLVRARVGQHKRLEELTDRQRTVLVELLGGER